MSERRQATEQVKKRLRSTKGRRAEEAPRAPRRRQRESECIALVWGAQRSWAPRGHAAHRAHLSCLLKGDQWLDKAQYQSRMQGLSQEKSWPLDDLSSHLYRWPGVLKEDSGGRVGDKTGDKTRQEKPGRMTLKVATCEEGPQRRTESERERETSHIQHA
jgi:hypothetical protein